MKTEFMNGITKKSAVRRAYIYNGLNGFPLAGILQNVDLSLRIPRNRSGNSAALCGARLSAYMGRGKRNAENRTAVERRRLIANERHPGIPDGTSQVCKEKSAACNCEEHIAVNGDTAILDIVKGNRYKVVHVVPDIYRRRCVWRQIYI